MSSSLESLAVESSQVSSHSAKFESSRESPKKVTRVRLESLPATRVNNSADLHVLSREQRAINVRIDNSTVNHLHTEALHYIFANINVIAI